MDTGMVVLAVMFILLVGGGVVFLMPSRHSRDGNTGHETFNANAESPDALRKVSATADHPVSEPSFDTLAADGSSSAIAGAGAGGYTADARRPLIGGGGEAEAVPGHA